MKNIQKFIGNKKGFTFIELILYITLVGTVVLGISILLMLIIESRVKNQTIAEVEQQGVQMMQLMTQTLHNAEVVNSPATGNSAAVLSVDVLTGANDPTVFDLSGSSIRITEGAASPIELNSSRVVPSALTFENFSRAGTPGNIRIQFTLTHLNPGGRNEYEYSKTFLTSASLRQP